MYSLQGQTSKFKMSLELMVITLTLVVTHLILPVGGQAWQDYEGHCYTILTTQRNFNDSRVACQKIGSYLLELEQMPELDYVRWLINGSSNQFWIGLDYDPATKKFRWTIDGHEPNPAMWLPTEPNYTGYSVRLATDVQAGGASTGSIYYLADNPSASLYQAICEKNADLSKNGNFQKTVLPASNRCPMVPFQARATVDCAVSCVRNKSCIAFQYSVKTQDCLPYRFSVNCTSPQTSPPITMYVISTPRC